MPSRDSEKSIHSRALYGCGASLTMLGRCSNVEVSDGWMYFTGAPSFDTRVAKVGTQTSSTPPSPAPTAWVAGTPDGNT